MPRKLRTEFYPRVLKTRVQGRKTTKKKVMMSRKSMAREWFRRAVATIKDKNSLCLARLGSRDLYFAVIKATSHDEIRTDYKSAGEVFSWARASPSVFLLPIMKCITLRACRTRSWPVALKLLMLAHGVLLCCRPAFVGRLPFDLSDFLDRSSRCLSAFVRAYFKFLDQRSIFLSEDNQKGLGRVGRTQDLLHLLMQVRPYGDEGAGERLLLEAMDCVVIDAFEIYGDVCSGMSRCLVSVFGAGSSALAEEGEMGIRMLRRAAEQSSQLSAYFELCRCMGVLNAGELPPVERIPEEDIEDLEMLLFLDGYEELVKEKKMERLGTEDWVEFDEEDDSDCRAEAFVGSPAESGPTSSP